MTSWTGEGSRAAYRCTGTGRQRRLIHSGSGSSGDAPCVRIHVDSPSIGISPIRIASDWKYSRGHAMNVAAITVHGRFVRAPQITSTTAIGMRGHTGIGNGHPGVSEYVLSAPSQSNHSCGAIANEIAAITPAGTTAKAILRHSQRKTNHRTPWPI